MSERLRFFLSYILQPLMVLWGLSQKHIDFALAMTPLVFTGITFIMLLLSYMIASRFEDQKEVSIVTVTGLRINAGNIGMSLAIVYLGPEYIPYAVLVQLANIFFNNIFGGYFYAKGHYSFKDAIKKTLFLPVTWALVIGVTLNYFEIPFYSNVFMMAAYAFFIVQLFIFGINIAFFKWSHVNYPVVLAVNGIKFILFPAVAFAVLSFIELNVYAKTAIFFMSLMPIAVNNINLATLFNCKPKDVTVAVLVSNIVFIPYFYLFSFYLKDIFN